MSPNEAFKGRIVISIDVVNRNGNGKVDQSRCVPTQKMPTKEEAEQEVKRYGLNNMKVIDLASEEVRLAAKYLELIDEKKR